MKFPVVKVSVAPYELGYTLAREVFDKIYSRGFLRRDDLRDIKVRVSFKVGKKRKLRNVRFKFLGYVTYCKCCGPELVYEYASEKYTANLKPW